MSKLLNIIRSCTTKEQLEVADQCAILALTNGYIDTEQCRLLMLELIKQETDISNNQVGVE